MTSGFGNILDIKLTTTQKEFLKDALYGLSQKQKSIPSKYFYDQRGSELFHKITELPEYYPTRTELGVMREHAGHMAIPIGLNVHLIELGSGSTTKIRLLLEHLMQPAGYTPIDISEDYLVDQARQLEIDFPELFVHPLAADFMNEFTIPDLPNKAARRIVYFPGSTIGNLNPAQSLELLKRIHKIVAPKGGLLIGLDLKKDPRVLEAAYNDSQGITKEFNMNILHRLKNELGADLDSNQFEHLAFYNERESRIEMHLRSRRNQSIQLGHIKFELQEDETIHTENSYKFDLEEFGDRARSAGFKPVKSWTDKNNWFGVQYLEC